MWELEKLILIQELRQVLSTTACRGFHNNALEIIAETALYRNTYSIKGPWSALVFFQATSEIAQQPVPFCQEQLPNIVAF
jgi:hypothetical protein